MVFTDRLPGALGYTIAVKLAKQSRRKWQPEVLNLLDLASTVAVKRDRMAFMSGYGPAKSSRQQYGRLVPASTTTTVDTLPFRISFYTCYD